jgi:hypothetical protein
MSNKDTRVISKILWPKGFEKSVKLVKSLFQNRNIEITNEEALTLLYICMIHSLPINFDDLTKLCKLKKKRITVSSAKGKGRKLQQWVCKKISEITGFNWGHDCPIESRGMGQNGVDVRLEKEVLEKFPWSVEAKSTEMWSVPAAIEQAKANQMPGTNWLLVLKKKQQKPVAVLDAEEFFKLYKKFNRKKRNPPKKL